MFNNNGMNNNILDKYQFKAVSCNKKNYLVVAGAGSGKTLTIIEKVKYLVNNGYDNNKILCISFTNETVNNLKNKFNNIGLNIDVKTFHKLSLDIIGKRIIESDYLLKYIIDEYFLSLVYLDNSYKLLKFIDNLDILKALILSFINQMKASNLSFAFLYDLLKSDIPLDDKIILSFIFNIYLYYQEDLYSENKVDFNDMINLAIKKIDSLNYFKYRYIIVDEYQDTSICKYLLLKKIQDKFDTCIMAVGDDYQSIYSFTGCDLRLFTKFKKYFKHSKIIKLKYTYRNPKDIVEISKRFVMFNRNQINKRLISNNYIKNSIVIIYYTNEIDTLNNLVKDLDNILILGRNNQDLDRIDDLLNTDKHIRLLTVHSSKGLEEDYVIILNVIDDTLGFPNKIKENHVFSYLKNCNLTEEERRLFYVALTRAKKRVFILTKKNQESVFIKELIRHFKYKIKIEDFSRKAF